MQWEENTTPLHPRGALGEKSVLNTVHSLSVEAGILKDVESRQRHVTEADHDKIDIDDCVATISTLSGKQQQLLATKLRAYPQSFSGGANKLKMPPVHMELKEGVTPKNAGHFQFLNHNVI